ncbi:MAG: cobalamin-dependent protein [Endomicrobiales bacterium]|nr:cobalamin-dependent protein [Endomicrobiales bacterium]
MKILLVNPPHDLETTLGRGALFVPKIEPLGLLYMAAVLKENGYDVRVIDAFAEELSEKELKSRILELNPDIVGFTSFTSNGGFLYDFGRKLKEERPQTLIVYGNTHASIYAQQYLLNKCCDIVVHGEGEYVLLQIVRQHGRKKGFSSVPAVSFVENGRVVTTPGYGLIEDLSALPFPARELVNKNRYGIGGISNFRLGAEEKGKTSRHMFTSRGCSNRCRFCAVHNNQKQRFNSIDRTISEIEILIKDYNAGYIFFMDSSFTIDRQRVINICNEIIRKKLCFRWGCEAYVKGMDKEIVRLMESAGCVDMNFGVETGVQRLLDDMNKRITIQDAKDAIETVKSHTNINAMGLFILGLPGESCSDSLETIEFSKKLPIDMAQFSVCVPYPGSCLFEELRNNGLDIGIRKDNALDTSVWQRYNAYVSFSSELPIWVTKEQSPDGLKKLQKKALRSFYFRLKPFWNQVKRIRLADVPSVVKAFFWTFF